MEDYLIDAKVEHKLWKRKMKKKVSIINKVTSATQKNLTQCCLKNIMKY